MPLQELATNCDYITTVYLCSIIESDTISSDKLLTQLTKDRSEYHIYNVTSLGNLARLIVSGQNNAIIIRAKEILNDYRIWYTSNKKNE